MKKIALIIFVCVLGACTKEEVKITEKVYLSVNSVPDSSKVEWVKELGSDVQIHFKQSQEQYFNVYDVKTPISDSMSYDGKIKLYFKNDTMYLHYKGNINKLK
jgi:hypothetical protein